VPELAEVGPGHIGACHLNDLPRHSRVVVPMRAA